MEHSTSIQAIDNKIVMTNSIEVCSSVATILESHLGDKLAKAQRKSPVQLTVTLIPSKKGMFIHQLEIATKKYLEPEQLVEAKYVLEKLHITLIESALIPSIVQNILQDLKPLEDEKDN